MEETINYGKRAMNTLAKDILTYGSLFADKNPEDVNFEELLEFGNLIDSEIDKVASGVYAKDNSVFYALEIPEEKKEANKEDFGVRAMNMVSKDCAVLSSLFADKDPEEVNFAELKELLSMLQSEIGKVQNGIYARDNRIFDSIQETEEKGVAR